MIPCLHFGLRLASGRFPIEPKLASRVESGYKSPDSPGPRQRGRRRDGLSRRRRGRFRSTAPYPAATNSRGVSKPRARRDNGLTFRHRFHDLGHFARLGSHGRVISSLSSASAGDPDLLHVLRQEQRQRRCLLDLTCSDDASLLPPVLASSPTWYQGSGRNPLGSSIPADKRQAPDHRR